MFTPNLNKRLQIYHKYNQLPETGVRPFSSALRPMYKTTPDNEECYDNLSETSMTFLSYSTYVLE
jgi:hypothetical protein